VARSLFAASAARLIPIARGGYLSTMNNASRTRGRLYPAQGQEAACVPGAISSWERTLGTIQRAEPQVFLIPAETSLV